MPDSLQPPDPAARGAPLGMRMLKKMWGIRESSARREKPPEDVQHDIYRVPDHKAPIPPRPLRRRRRRHGE